MRRRAEMRGRIDVRCCVEVRPTASATQVWRPAAATAKMRCTTATATANMGCAAASPTSPAVTKWGRRRRTAGQKPHKSGRT
jgi:hypothetical protein